MDNVIHISKRSEIIPYLYLSCEKNPLPFECSPFLRICCLWNEDFAEGV